MKRSDLIVVKDFTSRTNLLKFLNELDHQYNLSKVVISIVKDSFDRYEVFYKDYSLETEADRAI